jgi:hypothetical protein
MQKGQISERRNNDLFVARLVDGIKRRGQRKRPTTKPVRMICAILYSYNEKEPRSKNDIRTNCMKGHSPRPREFSNDMRELVYKKVYHTIRVGKGREKGQFVLDLTDNGIDLAKWVLKNKFYLDILGLPTTYNFGGQGWKNNCIESY